MVESKSRGRKKKSESDMVSTINTDLKVKQSDLDQIDVDNV